LTGKPLIQALVFQIDADPFHANSHDRINTFLEVTIEQRFDGDSSMSFRRLWDEANFVVVHQLGFLGIRAFRRTPI